MNNMHEDSQKERDQGARMGLGVAHGIMQNMGEAVTI
jgi:hypothetical protein